MVKKNRATTEQTRDISDKSSSETETTNGLRLTADIKRKSLWIADPKGNYSNEQKDTFDETKDYAGIRLEQGVPLLDRDWNELEDIRRYQDMILRRHYIGDGTPDDGFKITKISDEEIKDFIIVGGRYIVDGIEAYNSDDIKYTSEKNGSPKALDLVAGKDYRVYIDLHFDEIHGVEELKNLQDVKMETCARHKVVWNVKVAEFIPKQSESEPKYNWYAEIAVIKLNGSKLEISDLRRNNGLNKDYKRLNVEALTVRNDTVLNGVLSVEKEATLKDKLIAGKDAEVKGTLTVGQKGKSDKLLALNDAEINGTLTVGQKGKSGKLIALDDADINGTLIVGQKGENNKKLIALNDAEINGTLTVGKNITLKNELEFELVKDYDSDIARRFYTGKSIDLRIGEVVYFDRNGHLETENESENPRVAGVVSKKPRILLPGVETRSDLHKCFLVTQGVAPCRVMKNSTDKIEIGDFLTSAGPLQPGAAKKADMKNFKPGTIIGTALEKFDTAEILHTIQIFVMKF